MAEIDVKFMKADAKIRKQMGATYTKKNEVKRKAVKKANTKTKKK